MSLSDPRRLLGLVGAALAAFTVASAAAATTPTYTTNYVWDNNTSGTGAVTNRRLTMVIAADPGTGVRSAMRYKYDIDGELIEIDKGTTTSSTGSDFAALEITTVAFDAVGNNIQTAVLNCAGATPSSPCANSAPILVLSQTSYDADDRQACAAVRMNAAVFSSLAATPVSGSTAAYVLPTSALPNGACSLGAPGPYGNDRITQTSYDAAGEVTSTVKAFGDPLQEVYEAFTYTPDGQQLTVTDAVGNTTTYYYDGFDRLAQANFPVTTRGAGQSDPTAYQTNCAQTSPAGANIERYCYDANGNRTDLYKRDGTHLTFAYDALNRQTARAVPAETTPNLAAYTVNTQYDLLSQRKTALFSSNGLGVTDAWDNAGRLTSETTSQAGFSRTLSFQYDGASNRTRITWPETPAFYANYAYDALNHVTQIADSGGVVVATFGYDGLGRRTVISRNGGSNGTGGAGAATSYGYDAADRLASLAQTFPATPADNQSYAYAYTPAGQTQSQTAPSGPLAWTNLPAHSLSKTYDGLNRDSTIVAIGAPSTCGPSGGSVSYGYDCNGNLTNTGSTGAAYVYDQENRLITASTGSGTLQLSLAYDPVGRLEQSYAPATGATTQFLYAGDELMAEYNGATVLRRYVMGPGVDEPIAWYDYASGPQVINWLHADRQGSIIAASTGTGAVATTYAYGPYGEPQAWGGSRFAYTGQIQLPEAQLYHYKARAYDPSTGRFNQTDPIGYKSDADLYAYVGEDPTDKADPSGQVTVTLTVGGDVYIFAGGGGEAGVGVSFPVPVIDPKAKVDVGVIASGRAGGGLYQDLGPSLGFSRGSLRDQNGHYTVAHVQILAVGASGSIKHRRPEADGSIGQRQKTPGVRDVLRGVSDGRKSGNVEEGLGGYIAEQITGTITARQVINGAVKAWNRFSSQIPGCTFAGHNFCQ